MKDGKKNKIYLASGSYSYSLDKIYKTLTALQGLSEKPTVILKNNIKIKTYVKISDLCFAGDDVIEITKAPIIENCKFEGVAINFLGEARGKINNCEITASNNQGIGCYDASSPTVNNCNIHDVKGCGIHITESAFPIIKDCQIHDNEGHGLNIVFYSKPEKMKKQKWESRLGWMHPLKYKTVKSIITKAIYCLQTLPMELSMIVKYMILQKVLVLPA